MLSKQPTSKNVGWSQREGGTRQLGTAMVFLATSGRLHGRNLDFFTLHRRSPKRFHWIPANLVGLTYTFGHILAQYDIINYFLSTAVAIFNFFCQTELQALLECVASFAEQHTLRLGDELLFYNNQHIDRKIERDRESVIRVTSPLPTSRPPVNDHI